MAKSNPAVTPIGMKPNLQILPQNDATFSCFLPDDQSHLRKDSEPSILIKQKFHVACGETGWLRLKIQCSILQDRNNITVLAEDSEDTRSFRKFCRNISNHTRSLRAPSNLALNVSRDGASATSLCNLCQCFTTPTVKNVLLVSSLRSTVAKGQSAPRSKDWKGSHLRCSLWVQLQKYSQAGKG